MGPLTRSGTNWDMVGQRLVLSAGTV